MTETIDGTVHTYAYDDTWKDKLISYDGKAITYDVFGCPLDYMGTAMTWDIYGGLTSVDNGSDSITYTYMGDGQRRTKTVNGVTTTYHYNNGMLLSETTGDETLRYYYDSTGKVASIVYKKGDGEETGYFYARNAQGDIIAVYRSKDSKLMGTYEYDLWGRLISVNATAEDTDNITNKNPYRYRGYYYDQETGFYYLTARYYDPQIRRFISADSMNALMIATTDVTCKNLFVYAENNPVTNKDSSGNFVDMVFDVISLAGSIADVIKKPNDPLAWASLAGDAADVLIPGVSGIGEVIKGAKAVAIVAETAKVASGAGAVAEGAIKAKKAIGNLVDGAKSLGKKVKNGSSKATTAGFEAWLNKGASNNKVYFGMKGGQAKYTGITKQSKDARLYQHKRAGKDFDDLEIQHSDLTRNQARAIEQYYIQNGPNEMNNINSISPNNQYYQDALNWAQQYLGK